MNDQDLNDEFDFAASSSFEEMFSLLEDEQQLGALSRSEAGLTAGESSAVVPNSQPHNSNMTIQLENFSDPIIAQTETASNPSYADSTLDQRSGLPLHTPKPLSCTLSFDDTTPIWPETLSYLDRLTLPSQDGNGQDFVQYRNNVESSNLSPTFNWCLQEPSIPTIFSTPASVESTSQVSYSPACLLNGGSKFADEQWMESSTVFEIASNDGDIEESQSSMIGSSTPTTFASYEDLLPLGESSLSLSSSSQLERSPDISSSGGLEIIICRPSEESNEVDNTRDQQFHALPVKQTLFKDASGELQGTMMVIGRKSVKKGHMGAKKRKETAVARRYGICERCRRLKRRCDLSRKISPYESCTGCMSRTYKGLPRMPCFMSTLDETFFFRSGPLPNTVLYTTRQELFELLDMSKLEASVETLKINQDLGFDLTVYISEFVPLPTDNLSYTWKDSDVTKSIDMPPYCLANIDKTISNIFGYIKAAKRTYLNLAEGEDSLTWATISMAINYAEARVGSMVDVALSLWSASRMIERVWQTSQGSTVGLPEITHGNMPFFGMRPLTPYMNVQLAQIFIQKALNPYKLRLMLMLKNKIQAAKQSDWFEIYLTIFILLNSIEMLTRHNYIHGKRQGKKARFSYLPEVEESFHSAKILLSRFHFMCNGSAPLRLSWSSLRVASIAKLDPDQREFMEKTQSIIQRSESDIVSLRTNHQYETSLYWCHQMFYDNWDNSPSHIIDDVDPAEIHFKLIN